MQQSITIGSAELSNPVLTASGTFGYGLEFQEFFDVGRLGAICTKGLSLEPRLGNRPTRIAETPAGMLNAIGLANVGVEAFCTEKLPKLQDQGVTVVANIFASSTKDFVAIAERLARESGVLALELNVSCPNVSEGGIEFGKNPNMCAELTAATKAATDTPIWVKMSPEAPSIIAVAQACEDAGAEAITAINTIRGMRIDIAKRQPVLARGMGGFSGPSLKPVALRIVYELAASIGIPIIAIGGISTTEDALEFLFAGASAIQVGTASFIDPLAAHHVRVGIENYCEAHQLNASDLIGLAQAAKK